MTKVLNVITFYPVLLDINVNVISDVSVEFFFCYLQINRDGLGDRTMVSTVNMELAAS